MGQAWAESSAAAAAVFEQADEVLGFSLSEACWSGGESIHRTDLAQPAIFTSSVACLAGLKEAGMAPDNVQAVAGLSLGEYTALWYSGALSFEDGLRLVRLRGEAMQEASEASESDISSRLGVRGSAGMLTPCFATRPSKAAAAGAPLRSATCCASSSAVLASAGRSRCSSAKPL